MKAYNALFVFVPFAPVLIAISAGVLSLRLSRRRWIIHTAGFVAMAIALPVYLRIQALLGPTTVLYPGPGDGFVVLIYLLLLVPSVIGYAIFCYVSRR
jgi:hypothetical protein